MLDLFAHGSVSFLLALVALSVVTALISAAAEEFIRPLAQGVTYRAWLRSTIGLLQRTLDLELDDKPLARSYLRALDFDLLYLPSPLLAGAADQVSAQAAKRLDRLIASPRPDSVAPERPSSAPSRRWIEDMRRRLETLADDQVDLLQSQLIQRATTRAYGEALAISVAIGALLYGLARRTDPDLDLFTWFIVTGVLGFVATLLAPMLQTQVGRLLRVR